MADFPVIDAHVHTFATPEVGHQAMMETGHTDYGGTVGELLEVMRRGGIERAAMVNMTPVADMFDAAAARLPQDQPPAERARAEKDIRRQMIGRLQRRNQWTCQMAREHSELAAFIGLDPAMSEDEMLSEIEERRAEGAHGIKLHPAAQRFYPADPRLSPVYNRAQALEMPIIFHSGVFALGPQPADYSYPRYFRDVLAAFPRLTVVLAHLGMGDFGTCASLAQDFPNVFFDCCNIINGTEPSPSISDEEAAVAIKSAGTDRVMFGSDYPWFDPLQDAAHRAPFPL